MNELTTTTAQQINTLHEGLMNLLHQGIETAIRIGELLTLKKAELKHGEFGQWIADNLVFSDRTARNYMRLFENKEVALNSGNITEAYKMLSEGKTETVSVFAEMLPASGRMSVITTDSPKCEDIYIFGHEQPGYFRLFWFEKDSFDGLTCVGTRRGLNREGTLIQLERLLITIKNISHLTMTEDDELKKSCYSMIA